MGTIGNTFDSKTTNYGKAKKVWREIKAQYPSGGTIVNASDFVAEGKVPSGTAVKFDMSAKTITAYKADEIKSGDVSELGINGHLQEDAVVENGTIATGTVIYAGELYEYMFDEEVVAKLKANPLTAQIVFVQ